MLNQSQAVSNDARAVWRERLSRGATSGVRHSSCLLSPERTNATPLGAAAAHQGSAVRSGGSAGISPFRRLLA